MTRLLSALQYCCDDELSKGYCFATNDLEVALAYCGEHGRTLKAVPPRKFREGMGRTALACAPKGRNWIRTDLCGCQTWDPSSK